MHQVLFYSLLSPALTIDLAKYIQIKDINECDPTQPIQMTDSFEFVGMAGLPAVVANAARYNRNNITNIEQYM